MKVIGILRNNWRQRLVTIYEIGDEPDKVLTVGDPFDGSKSIVCVENRADWKRVINLYPKTAVYD